MLKSKFYLHMFLPSWESFLVACFRNLGSERTGLLGTDEAEDNGVEYVWLDIADDEEVDVDVEDALDGGVMDDSDVECLWNGVSWNDAGVRDPIDLRLWYLSGAGATIKEGCDVMLACETEVYENERECWRWREVIGEEYWNEESEGVDVETRDPREIEELSSTPDEDGV